MGNIPTFFQRTSAESEAAPAADAGHAPPSPTACDDPNSMMVPDRPTSSSSAVGKRKRRHDEGESSPTAEAPPPMVVKPGASAVTPTPPANKKAKPAPPQQRSLYYPERAAVLQTLPEAFQAMAGTIGFCKFGKKQRVPALIVDLAEAPRGEVWDQWMKAYHRRLEENKLHTLPYIVYYYCNDGNLCFGVVSRSAFTPYDVEAKKGDQGIVQLPERFQRKVNQGKPLTFHENCMIEAYECMEEDLQKQPWERKRWEL